MNFSRELKDALLQVVETGILNLSHWIELPLVQYKDFVVSGQPTGNERRLFTLHCVDSKHMLAKIFFNSTENGWVIEFTHATYFHRCLNTFTDIIGKLNHLTLTSVQDKIPDKTLQQWAKLSLDLQDAVNGSGVTNTLYQWLCSPVARQLESTKHRNRHPITRMILYKLADLANIEYEFDGVVYDQVKALAGVTTTELEGVELIEEVPDG